MLSSLIWVIIWYLAGLRDVFKALKYKVVDRIYKRPFLNRGMNGEHFVYQKHQ